jgi:hypothetical protein
MFPLCTEFKLKVLQIGKNSILIIFRKNGFLAHSAKIFPNSRHQKIFLATLYHHANFQQNCSTIERFINNFNFFSIPEEKNRDESGAELVRDGPMVSLGNMMLRDSSFTMLNMRNIYFCCPTLNFIRS